MQTSQRDTRIDQMCNKIITERWGDIDAFPEEMTQTVYHIYREFIVGYLTFLRQKKAAPLDWFPETLEIDLDLVDDMRHFFSDYQHITKSFLTLNRQLAALCDIDKEKQPNMYQHMMTEITAGAPR